MTHDHARRSFLRYIAASPLFASGIVAAPGPEQAHKIGDIVASVDEAINVFDLHAVAREKLPPAHYGYLSTGTDDDSTIRANREGFKRYQLRVRRLVDVSNIDTSIELEGGKYATPIAICPTGNQKALHPEGEAAVARAANKTSSLMMLSTVATTSVEDVIQARGEPVWFQLYANGHFPISEAMLKRAERAGCPVVAWTVDMQGGSNRETLKRFSRIDKRDCSVCHDRSSPQTQNRRKPWFDGLDLSQSKSSSSMDWDFVRRLKDTTSMKLYIKGIVTAQDTQLCLENGVDGIIVSNHGGRAESSGRSTIECLEEVVAAANGQIPVIIDSGFRRGTDVFKALALGADAIGVGRPFLWGLASFGEEGVQTALNLMLAELRMVMRQAGTTSIDKISPSYILPVR